MKKKRSEQNKEWKGQVKLNAPKHYLMYLYVFLSVHLPPQGSGPNAKVCINSKTWKIEYFKERTEIKKRKYCSLELSSGLSTIQSKYIF